MHYIGGSWHAGNGPNGHSHDPFNNETVWEGQWADAQDVQSAVEAARHAASVWSGVPLKKRQDYLQAFAVRLKENDLSLAELISREVGKPLWESRGEVAAMINKIGVSLTAYSERCPTREVPFADNARSLTRFKPHGVVAVFGPFNFPGHLPSGHIVPALLAGNTVVFKPSEMAPAVGQRMAELWHACDLPKGVFNVVQGARETGVALAGHPGLDGLYFTGSSLTGQAIHRQFAGHPDKILALEMGGNNPLIIHEIDDVDAAVYWTIQSAYLTAGQRCVCARRLILTEAAQATPLMQRLQAALPRIRMGHYSDRPEPFMGPVISSSAAERILAQQENLTALGARVLASTQRINEAPALLRPGLLDVTGVTGIPDEEIFGPVLQVLYVSDLEHAVKTANDTAYGLAAAIFCRDRDDFEYFVQYSRAGIVNWNRPTTGASSSAPFGGVGLSGNHRPSAYFAADYCAYPVASIEAEALQLPNQLSPGLDW